MHRQPDIVASAPCGARAVGWASPTTPQASALRHATLPAYQALIRAPSASAGFLAAPHPNGRSLSLQSASMRHPNRRHRSTSRHVASAPRGGRQLRRGPASADPRWRIVKTSVVILSLIVSALVLSMEIASPSPSWLRWFTLLPLLAAIRFMPPIKAFACGALWGISLFLVLAHGPGFKPIPHALLPATIQSFALLSLIPAAYAFLGARLARVCWKLVNSNNPGRRLAKVRCGRSGVRSQLSKWRETHDE